MLRFERRDNRFIGYVSDDNEKWYRCGWVDMIVKDPIQIGVHAICLWEPFTSTRFEYVKVYRPDNQAI